MKTFDRKPDGDDEKHMNLTPCGTITRREFLIDAAAIGVTILLSGDLFAAVDGKKTFTILHTNDMHSNFIGMGPASDYTPLTVNDDKTTGGYARIAVMIAMRKKSRESQEIRRGDCR